MNQLRTRRRQSGAPRADYLRLVPPPGPVTPATPCPAWCVVAHEEHTDRFHYGETIDIEGVSVNPEILDDGSKAARLGMFGADGELLSLAGLDELIEKLVVVRATLRGELVAA